MKYERPDLEEMELELEGSFLAVQTTVGGEINPDPVGPGGDENPDSPWN